MFFFSSFFFSMGCFLFTLFELYGGMHLLLSWGEFLISVPLTAPQLVFRIFGAILSNLGGNYVIVRVMEKHFLELSAY